MAPPLPFVRDAGSGPGVVCLHSNASSSSQWRGLMELLAPRFRVLAPDSYGSGKSPEWPSDRQIGLADEVALIEPVLRDAGSPLTLVGHSYGAAIALRAALDRPARIRRLVLYEPTLFSLVDAEAPPPNAADGIRQAVADAALALDRGDRDRAAEAFIDYWMGEGSLAADARAATPADRRLGRQRSPLGPRALHRADAAAGVSRAGRAGALPGRRTDDGVGPRRGAPPRRRAAAGRGAGVRGARAHGSRSPIPSG